MKVGDRLLKKVFLAIGNEELEKRISQMSGFEIADKERDLEMVKNLLEFLQVDCVIVNRLLDEDGSMLLAVAKEAKQYGIKIILLMDNYEDYTEKKLITQLVSYEVYGYIKLAELSEDSLLKLIDEYPPRFDFNLLRDASEEADTVIESVVPIGFKKLILTVWDNAEFGCELAYIAAKHTDHKVLLIDLDLLAPKADMILNVPKHAEGIKSQGIFTSSGLNIILDSIDKDIFKPELFYEAAVKRKENKNLHVLTGNYKLENYEYYNNEGLEKLIEYAYRSFDLTILLVNRSIYDEFTFRALARSDYNLLAKNADLPTVREFNRYVVLLKSMQQIPIEKTKLVAFEYIRGLDLEHKLIKELVENNYIGSIGYSKLRRMYRNKRAPYMRRMEDSTKADYFRVLGSLRITVKRSFKDIIGSKLGRLFRLIRKPRRIKKYFERKGA